MQIIDIHTHIYPNDIAQKATDSVRNFYDIGTDGLNGTVEQLLRHKQAAGIDKCVVLPVAIRPDRVRGINEFIHEQSGRHQDFIGFGTVHAAMDNIGDEVGWVLDHGLHGIKMHPDSQRFAIDDLRLFPMYEAAEGRIPLLIHIGDHRYDYSHPVKLHRILDLFPRLQVIAAHFGGYSMYEEACDILWDTNCVFDISSSLMFLQEGKAEQYINTYGAERVAFGSDYPMWDPVTEVETFMNLKLSPEQLEQIAWKTASRVLKLG